MYVVTNRKLWHRRSGLKVFGQSPNVSGPNELRLVRVDDDHYTEILGDHLSNEEVEALVEKHGLSIDTREQWFSSLRVACELFEKAIDNNCHILLFVHGYNNDMQDVVETAQQIELNYNLIVVPFSWPANGGGPISGKLAYLSDKDDARASAIALHRTIDKVGYYHRLLTDGLQERLWATAVRQASENHENARARFSELLEEKCKTTLNLMCHSMGNYVLKHATLSSTSSTRNLVFDNVCLVAADVNNPGHETWVECIPSRKRLYVVINENDWALKWSRIKPGNEQKERLGHNLKNLNASNAYYIDVTRSKNVESQHSYFKGEALKNETIKGIFSRILTGGIAEQELAYDSNENVYRPSH